MSLPHKIDAIKKYSSEIIISQESKESPIMSSLQPFKNMNSCFMYNSSDSLT